MTNGDYRVTVTALNRIDNSLHDFHVRLQPVETIADVEFPPGIPQLIVGQEPRVSGVNAKGASYKERCGSVPANAEWSPLRAREMPLPGSVGDVAVSEELHDRSHVRQTAGKDTSAPLVVAREPVANSLGVILAPARWNEAPTDPTARPTARGRILCAVRITGVDPRDDTFNLDIQPLPTAKDRLPGDLATQLYRRFETYIRQSGDRGWRFKSAMVLNATDDRSVVYSVMHYLSLLASESEFLLTKNNEERARWLLDYMNNRSF